MNKLIGMIGFGLIAKIHSKIMFENNCPIRCVLVRSEESIEKTKNFFVKEFSYTPLITNDCNFFFSKKIDILLICSPPSTHFKFLLKAFDNNISVFCEKPLFWDKELGLEEFKNKISILESHENKNFLVNTSNTYFLKSLMANIKVKKIKYLKFIFHTNGSAKYQEISEDLLPHGLSILIEILGFSNIKKIEKIILESNVNYKFRYSNAQVEFEFKEDPLIEKNMTIYLNEHKFTRIQVGNNSNYRVSFRKEDGTILDNFEDPFRVYSKLFLKGYRQHEKDLYNLKLMNQITKGFNEVKS